MYGDVFVFAGGLGTGEGGTQIIYVNVHHVALPPGGGLHHLQYCIPVLTFFSVVRCFEL